MVTVEGVHRFHHLLPLFKNYELLLELLYGIIVIAADAAHSGPADLIKDRVRLVCGTTSMYTELNGLIAIVRYHLRCDPYDGSVYVFRDASGSKLKYIEWDGQNFLQGKRTAQSGTYPWPPVPAGTVVEVSEKEFCYLLSKSIVPFKER